MRFWLRFYILLFFKCLCCFQRGRKEGTKNPHRREGDGGHKCSPAVRSAPDKKEIKTRYPKTIGEKEMSDRLSNKKRDAPFGEHPLRFLLLFPLRGVEAYSSSLAASS